MKKSLRTNQPSYTAWWQRHTSSLQKATAQWCRGKTQTRDL